MTDPRLAHRSVPDEPPARGRILVVDDEHSIRYTFALFLDEAGHETTAVADPDEALRVLAASAVDLAFVDILLESTSGIDLMEQIKRRSPGTEVVIVTGAPSVETAADALRLGAFDYLVKPVGQEALLRTASVALRHKALRDEAERCRTNLEAIFQSIEDGIVTVGERLETVEVNRAAEQLCGFHREDVVGRPLNHDVLRCSGRCLQALRRSVTGGPSVVIRHVECRAEHRPNQVVDVKATPLYRGGDGPSGSVLVIRDQTRLEDLEQSLRRQASDLVGESPALRGIRSTIESLSEPPAAVLITGEQGTGKKVVAEALHGAGRRRPLLRIDCSAVSGDLLERELFGQSEGESAGAGSRAGWLDLVRGGTLIAAEIAELPLRLQERLMRVLENLETERSLDSETLAVGVRVLATSSHDLEDRVANGLFREDLYARLRALEIHVPPLRERREDLPALVHHLLSKLDQRLGKGVTAVSDAVLEEFRRYPWPGNVRELEQTLEHAFVVAQGAVITPRDLPAELRDGGATEVEAAVTA